MTAAPRAEPTVRWLARIADVAPEAWDALARPGHPPFMEWGWLHRMEGSGSISAATGWLPRHLTLWEGARLVAAAPLYVKGHSEGEFVFDQAWAEVAGRLGSVYYPKLVGMSPVTPAPGYRFLIAPDRDEEALTAQMAAAIERFCLRNRLGGCSFLYVDPGWRRRMRRHGYGAWTHPGFVWINRDYRTFDDYLARFKTNQRRNIRREIRSLERRGIETACYEGERIPPRFLPLMYRYYARTNDRFGPWGCKYLTPEFFDALGAGDRRHLLLVAGFEPGDRDTPVGMSMLLTKGDRLFGRYWGSRAQIPDLHFNLCYYRPIAWSIDRRIGSYDPGIGGHHKVRRGFRADPRYSLHRFFEPRMRQVWELNIDTINRAEREHIDEINRMRPFARRP